MKMKYFSILFAVAGIFFLYFLSQLSQPPYIEIKEMKNYDGKQVIVEGIVTDYKLTKQGNQIITIDDKNTKTTVFVEGKTEVEYGDKIRVTGSVQKYENNWEIVIDNNRLLKIVEKWHSISFPLWQLAENPTKYLNLNVNVTGILESSSNAFFYLIDSERGYSIIVFYDLSRNITIIPGQKVCVLGKFSFDEENFRYQLNIFEEKHKIIFMEKK